MSFPDLVILIIMPAVPTVKNITAIPEPLPDLKKNDRMLCNGDSVLINGSKT